VFPRDNTTCLHVDVDIARSRLPHTHVRGLRTQPCTPSHLEVARVGNREIFGDVWVKRTSGAKPQRRVALTSSNAATYAFSSVVNTSGLLLFVPTLDVEEELPQGSLRCTPHHHRHRHRRHHDCITPRRHARTHTR